MKLSPDLLSDILDWVVLLAVFAACVFIPFMATTSFGFAIGLLASLVVAAVIYWLCRDHGVAGAYSMSLGVFILLVSFAIGGVVRFLAQSF